MSKAKALGKTSIFIPLTKVDEEQRLVYGRITAEELDKSGEVMDYKSSKPEFEKWSSGIEAASGGLSKGNVRVMHGSTVAGKLTELEFNDDEQSIEVCSKVVDDNEWNKVLEGCYTGFSVGGKYGKRWNETIDGQTVKKYTAVPSEVSIVDNPCVTSATFSLVKADGTEQDIIFKSVNDTEGTEASVEETTIGERAANAAASEQGELSFSNEDIARKATEIAMEKNDGSTWTDHIETAREELGKAGLTQLAVEEAASQGKSAEETDTNASGEGATNDADEAAGTEASSSAASVEKVTPAGVRQAWLASDGTAFEKKADAEAHDAGQVPPNLAQQLTAALAKVAEGVDAAEQIREENAELTVLQDFSRLEKAVRVLEESADDELKKGMYNVSRFADVIATCANLTGSIRREEKSEGDESGAAVAEAMIEAVKQFSESFIAYASAQVAEILVHLGDDKCEYFYCMAKEEGADALTKDVAELIELTKDETAEAKERLAKLAPVEEEEEVEEEGTEDMAKVVAENDELRKAVAEALPQIEKLTKRIKVLEDTPLPRAPRNIIEKGATGAEVDPTTARLQAAQELLKNYTPDQIATMMIKASQGQPLTMGGGR